MKIRGAQNGQNFWRLKNPLGPRGSLSSSLPSPSNCSRNGNSSAFLLYQCNLGRKFIACAVPHQLEGCKRSSLTSYSSPLLDFFPLERRFPALELFTFDLWLL